MYRTIIFALSFVIRVIKYVYNGTGALNVMYCVFCARITSLYVQAKVHHAVMMYGSLCAVCKDQRHCFTLIKARLLAGQSGQTGPEAV